MIEDNLSQAFCDDIVVRRVPDGLVVKTGFQREDGDAIGFYIVSDPNAPTLSRLEDDGATIPFLVGCGVDFNQKTRAKALKKLLVQYDAEYDDVDAVIHTAFVPESELPKAAMKFVALLLRTSDFLLLTEQHIAKTFQEDAAKKLRELIGDRAVIRERELVSEDLSEVTADMVFEAPNRPPVALIFGTSAQRVNDAIFLHMAALYERHDPISVITLLERDTSISRDLLRRAMNRLAAVPSYGGDKDAAIERVAREVVGRTSVVH